MPLFFFGNQPCFFVGSIVSKRLIRSIGPNLHWGHSRMDVDLVALGGDLVNFPSPQSVDDLYNELMKLLDEDELGSVGQQQW